MQTLKWRATAPLLRKLLPDLPPPTHEVDIRPGLKVPMRDGVELVGDLYLPRGQVDPGAPTFVVRSPYGRGGFEVLFSARPLVERGFPVFVQSCRGTFGSGGVFSPQVHEQDDGVDTLRWVRQRRRRAVPADHDAGLRCDHLGQRRLSDPWAVGSMSTRLTCGSNHQQRETSTVIFPPWAVVNAAPLERSAVARSIVAGTR